MKKETWMLLILLIVTIPLIIIPIHADYAEVTNSADNATSFNTGIYYNTKIADDAGMVGTNKTYLTIQNSSYYQIVASTQSTKATYAAAPWQGIGLFINDIQVGGGEIYNPYGPGYYASPISFIGYLTAGTKVSVRPLESGMVIKNYSQYSPNLKVMSISQNSSGGGGSTPFMTPSENALLYIITIAVLITAGIRMYFFVIRKEGE